MLLTKGKKIIAFYRDGFRAMRLGRTLWAIILIKLFILLGVLKLFFLPDYLDSRFMTEQEKADYVFENITQLSVKHLYPAREYNGP